MFVDKEHSLLSLITFKEMKIIRVTPSGMLKSHLLT